MAQSYKQNPRILLAFFFLSNVWHIVRFQDDQSVSIFMPFQRESKVLSIKHSSILKLGGNVLDSWQPLCFTPFLLSPRWKTRFSSRHCSVHHSPPASSWWRARLPSRRDGLLSYRRCGTAYITANEFSVATPPGSFASRLALCPLRPARTR